MDDNIKTWLKDIDLAIAEINSFLPENKNFDEFQKDLRTKRAIERNINSIIPKDTNLSQVTYSTQCLKLQGIVNDVAEKDNVFGKILLYFCSSLN